MCGNRKIKERQEEKYEINKKEREKQDKKVCMEGRKNNSD
jgi:hypothetical protein